ncbi:3-oxoacyl-acp synthase : 3-oxoacyl-[acyl-carrier-protein] synthase 2 OS=Planctomyces limnophilus (strain ATCC 43296 / DSM 3776 / IFAM 1008 / 290) GN=Plim_3120 PE=3 SV=1: ketoacyl-synt: Ketoacyl-synt_C [Gemmata massiliana]|uniref:3-oxoacyl-[acyl-carrier-protein] synthase 2 n=1 Tax=Gemmata massiliana TaxID=1210884 RepID=A0A6P2CTA9_9BACT|nr:beta-ketoacyl-ACP synthase II [Gemmata massiliana]VTR92181.1 3-oxoacyl-acp synthase : 3-oxoacyl-[acyl-carrier-protein] synthase 2 OS=Planctomyces limnophilus (strain ATCC 43296 / DSM 3776 / IFAM 1008 / 290) GN=Plim_3120 PE=3 SV=1: ketoacyl-synt: Ketoacyl-synt_C [Gemmata massiliana]
MRRRVVITGMGVITPLGHSVGELFASQIEGRTAVGPISRFDASTLATTFASEVKHFDLAKYLKDATRFAHSGLNTRFALGAAQQAIADAELLDESHGDRGRIGVYLGVGEGQENFAGLINSTAAAVTSGSDRADPVRFITALRPVLDARNESEVETHTTIGHLANLFALDGPTVSCLTACAAGSQAIGEAAELIRTGDADAMVAGGSQSMLHPLGVAGFTRLSALSQRNDSPQTASRPFDLTRDGFVIGEGAGVVVLEELEHAKARGATIYAELTGYGSTADAYRMTDPHPAGKGAIRCIANALTDAGLRPIDIGYINAHGTSTAANDAMETVAIKSVFGDYAHKIPVSSSKSMLGHLIAAAGAVELVISVMAIRSGVLPPTTNYETKDPACDLDYIPNAAREVRVDHVLSNSFGFGGQNVALVMSRYRA